MGDRSSTTPPASPSTPPPARRTRQQHRRAAGALRSVPLALQPPTTAPEPRKAGSGRGLPGAAQSRPRRSTPRRRKTDPRVLLVSPTRSVHYRKRKIGCLRRLGVDRLCIGIQWKGQRVTGIDSKPDNVVVLDRTTGAVLRELILGRSGPTTATAESVTDLARTQKPHRRRCF